MFKGRRSPTQTRTRSLQTKSGKWTATKIVHKTRKTKKRNKNGGTHAVLHGWVVSKNGLGQLPKRSAEHLFTLTGIPSCDHFCFDPCNSFTRYIWPVIEHDNTRIPCQIYSSCTPKYDTHLKESTEQNIFFVVRKMEAVIVQVPIAQITAWGYSLGSNSELGLRYGVHSSHSTIR